MKYIGTGKPVSLKSLIVSGDVHDDDKIQIFNEIGSFMSVGTWYQDQILNWLDKVGVATRSAAGTAVKFKFL